MTRPDSEGPDLRRLDLNLLPVFRALMEERSATRAGARLFLSQPAVSGALARLREFFGDELLVREGRSFTPTPRATELMAGLLPHLEGLAAAISGAAAFEPETARRVFRIGCTDAVALAILPRLRDDLARLAPRCDLVLRIGDYRTLPDLLAAGDISAAAGFLRDALPDAAKQRVLRHAPWVVVRDAATPAVADAADFAARRHALVTPLGDLEGFVDEALAQAGLSRRVSIGVTSFALLAAALPGSDLVATVPDFVAGWLASLAGLAVDRLPVEVPPVANYLAWRTTADRDPAEIWLRERIVASFAAAARG
jgi:LysR family transcriptional activator of mexEF-oprN operon